MNSTQSVTASELIGAIDHSGVVNLTKLTDLVLEQARRVGYIRAEMGREFRGFLIAHGFDSIQSEAAWENLCDIFSLDAEEIEIRTRRIAGFIASHGVAVRILNGKLYVRDDYYQGYPNSSRCFFCVRWGRLNADMATARAYLNY